MPQIIPIKDLKNTGEISEICHNSNEPVFVTKNGYGDMVIMSMETYEKTMFINDIYNKLEKAEKDIESGNVMDAFEVMENLRQKYEL